MKKYFAIIIGLFFLQVATAKKIMIKKPSFYITKIEPQNWWTNMVNDTVQIMVYGKNLQNMQAIAESKTAKIVNVYAVDKDYAFVDVVIAKNTKPQDILINFVSKYGDIITKKYPILQNPNWKPAGFNQADLVYLIMPDRFSNGTLQNDNVPDMEQSNRSKVDGRHGGDLQGISMHLDYIKKLGATALWLTPFQEMNDSNTSYHGYGASNFYEADARYASGTKNAEANNNAYISLTKNCHDMGLKVVMDVVLNHIGAEHDWTKHNPPISNWVHDSSQCNFQMSVLNDPHSTTQDANTMEKGWFWKGMPDLNQNNPRLATYLIQNNIWWVNTAKLDAIRLDTAPFSDKNYLTQWATALQKEFPTLSLVGEVWSNHNTPNATSYWQKNTRNADGYNSKIPSVMDMPLWENLVNGLDKDTAIYPYFILAQDYLYEHPENNFVLVGNHDMARFYTAVGENFDKYKLGLLFIATTRGIPQLYYGDEIAMMGVKGINDGIMRKDMPGGWANDAKNIFTQNGYTTSDIEMQALTFNTKLWNWRKTNLAVQQGQLKHYYPKQNVYIAKRSYKNKTTIMIFNFSKATKILDPKEYKEVLSGFTNSKTIFSSKNTDFVINKNLQIPGYGYLIIEVE